MGFTHVAMDVLGVLGKILEIDAQQFISAVPKISLGIGSIRVICMYMYMHICIHIQTYAWGIGIYIYIHETYNHLWFAYSYMS